MPGKGLRMAGSIPVSPPAGRRRPKVPAMPTAHTDWIDIAYAEHGDPAGQPVLLLHGFPDSRDTWDGVVDELRSERLRLIVPDLRGYGDTRILQADAGGGMEAALGQDAVDLIDALQLGKTVVVGQDWGARAAYAAAALYPDRVQSIVTLATPYVCTRGGSRRPRRRSRRIGTSGTSTPTPGAKGFKHDVVGFCRHLWQAWSPAWRFTDAEFDQASQAWHRPEFADLVLHAYRVRYGNAPRTPRYARQQAALDARPKITVPCWFAPGLADACNLPDSAPRPGAVVHRRPPPDRRARRRPLRPAGGPAGRGRFGPPSGRGVTVTPAAAADRPPTPRRSSDSGGSGGRA